MLFTQFLKAICLYLANTEEKITNVEILRQIKSEMLRSNRISNDMEVDANATKIFYDTQYGNAKLPGYVQLVNSSPFGALLISRIQVIMWEKLSSSNYPVWHIDSTGSILKNAKGKQVKLYSIIVYNKTNKFYIPVAEFFSNCNTSTEIASYLYKIKHILQTNISPKTKQIAPIIVTDFDKAIRWRNK